MVTQKNRSMCNVNASITSNIKLLNIGFIMEVVSIMENRIVYIVFFAFPNWSFVQMIKKPQGENYFLLTAYPISQMKLNEAYLILQNKLYFFIVECVYHGKFLSFNFQLHFNIIIVV